MEKLRNTKKIIFREKESKMTKQNPISSVEVNGLTYPIQSQILAELILKT
jgi:hypothetical protein